MTGRLHNVYAVSVLLQHTALPEGSMWPSPGKVPVACLQGFLGNAPTGPLLTISQAHNPPIVQAPTLRLHEFKCGSVLLSHVELDLFAEQHHESLSCRNVGEPSLPTEAGRLGLQTQDSLLSCACQYALV